MLAIPQQPIPILHEKLCPGMLVVARLRCLRLHSIATRADQTPFENMARMPLLKKTDALNGMWALYKAKAMEGPGVAKKAKSQRRAAKEVARPP